MPRVSAAFFTLSVTCLAIGMLWGMHMAQSDDFAMAPAHAHLNLLGGVLSAIFGTFYALTRETYSPRLSWINFLLSLIATAVTIPALAMLLSTNDDAKFGPITGIGSGIMVLSLLVFAVSVLRELLRKRA
jgi:CDP-diglyceride synthetase